MILVTGGAGFIGSNLVDYLLASGSSVRVLDNLVTGSIANLSNAMLYGPRFELIVGDISSADVVRQASHGVKCIIHLAAQVSVQNSIQHSVFSANTNIIGFLNVLEAVRINSVPRLIYASSAAVYGHPVDLPLNEKSPTNPISPYGLEKLINEQYACLYSRMHGISSLGFRFFNVYGPRQDSKSPYAGVISKFMRQIADDKPVTIFGDGRQSRDFVYVYDVALACAKAIGSSANGVLCVGTGRSVSLIQLVHEIEFVVCKKARVIFADPIVGDIVHSSMTTQSLSEVLNLGVEVELFDGLKVLYQSLCKNDRE